MSDLLSPVLVLAGLIGVFAIIFRGVVPKRRGPGIEGFLTRLTSPSDLPIALATLSSFAVAIALSRLKLLTDTKGAVAVGVLIGILVAVPLSQQLTVWVCGNVVSPGLAAWEAVLFIRADSEFDAWTSRFRASLMLLVFATFVLGMMIFNRGKAIHGHRGLALFGLIEIITFAAAPSGREIFELAAVGAGTYIVVCCGLAFLVGARLSEFLLGLISMAVTVTVWFEASVYGDIEAGDPLAAWLGFVAAVSAAIVVLVIFASLAVGTPIGMSHPYPPDPGRPEPTEQDSQSKDGAVDRGRVHGQVCCRGAS